jgi:glycosyltransferase involved in cell wall biosynthesis
VSPAVPGSRRISVVVPTLNEAAHLAPTLDALHAGAVDGPVHEVVVSDSGSRDQTLRVARHREARLAVPAAPLENRAAACNQGARMATGEVLLFLDADVALPRGWDRAVAAALRPGVVGGAFELTFDTDEGSAGHASRAALHRVERINRLRYRCSRHFYGDQALFVRRDAFRAAGGFPELPVLESAHLCKALKRRGRLVLLPLAVRASARRFVAGGVARVFLLDLVLWAGFALHLPPHRLGRRYWEANRRGDFHHGPGAG